ncbi:hypothetical protein Gogos_008737, partial [Gossypium gossypioides]|nr:hypothetical protein [Gossypium gossypioides]
LNLKEFCITISKGRIWASQVFPGIEVAQSEAGIVLNQRKYALKLIHDTKLGGAKTTITPLEQNQKLTSYEYDELIAAKSNDDEYADAAHYKRLIRCLLYSTHLVNLCRGNAFLVPGVIVATLLMLGVLHAQRLYDDKKVSPVDGTILRFGKLNSAGAMIDQVKGFFYSVLYFAGRLYSVNEHATGTIRNLYVENERVNLMCEQAVYVVCRCSYMILWWFTADGCDFDWASSLMTRQSVSRFCVKLRDSLLSWKSKKQSTVTFFTRSRVAKYGLNSG